MTVPYVCRTLNNKYLQMMMETPTANLQRNHQKKIRSRTARTKRGKQKKRQTQVNFSIVFFPIFNFHYNLFLIFVFTTVFNVILLTLQWKLRWILFLTSTKKRTRKKSLTRN